VYDETEPDTADKPVLGDKGRKYKKVNWMKAAFLSADKLLTVSPTYATEIAANESLGVELDGVIRCACQLCVRVLRNCQQCVRGFRNCQLFVRDLRSCHL